MARADGTDKGVETGGGVHADAPDARLTELLRTSSATVYPALQELRTRHQPGVLAYARLCTASESAARQLAAQAFTLAARQTARGAEPLVPLRLQLLLLTGRLAASWAGEERAGGLDPGLLLVLSTAGAEGPVPPMLTAFQSLPSRVQGLVWYGVVERETDDRTAGFLGLTREDVSHETASALQAMGQACLRARLAASDDPRCGNFGRLIEESVRPDSPRESADLHAHMARCPHCTTAYEELSALRDSPRTALAEGLLPWAGTAYVTREAPRPRALADVSAWPPSRRFLLASVALGVALTPLLLFLLSQGGSSSSPSPQAAGAVSTPPSRPQVTVTATVSPTPSPSATAKSPSPTKSSSPSAKPSTSPRPSPTPAHAPNGAYAQVVNVATGFCLDIRDGDLENGTDVVTAPCSSSRTQRWRVDSARGVVQSSADPGFCLDSRGDVDKGAGIWDCGSVDGDHGRNLSFTVDPDGVIRPAIAIETALTPYDGDGVALRPLSGGGRQRWRAGAA
ncbi:MULTISPECIES: RICIN domain-containing protein [unclassified Streptomyces]|uniref:RICIN domain-containing protein n=1 Tax=unclassified Streptomyces TaxID=2593676 RepID=UPI002257D224|nr:MULTISPECIES: RICIN domain-containing protein [unclassified Streptomyces]MCX5056587.1 RICIN domain-containing protein [Streptomyces sp. NBC_00452]MCX5287689.1 RICIN domain-containing protein [Streptomyces sp. NBC_00183]